MPDSISEERSALFVATLTSFMAPFMLSAVNVALPAIQAELDVDAVTLSWIPTAYLLATAVLLVPIGKVADRYGRRKIFTAGLVLYTISSTLIAWVPTAAWLIGMRIVQGFGAAMFITTGMAILSAVFAPERRGRAIGIYVAAVYIGLSLGPFAGGLLSQHVGWRSIFLLMLPLGSASIWVTLHFLKREWAERRNLPFDLIGSVLYAMAICALIYGAIDLPAPGAWALVALGVVGIGSFVWREKRAADPIFDIALFQYNRTFALSSLAALINYAATYGVTFLLSLFLQYIKGFSSQTAGIVLVAQPVVMALFSPLAGRLADRIEPRWIATLGMLITAIGLAGLIPLNPDTHIIYIICDLVLLGFGFALFSSPNMSAIMGSVAPHHYGIASGTVAAMRLLGQMVSMATAAVVLAHFIGRAPIGPDNYPLFIESTQMIFLVFVLICIPGIYFSFSRGALRKQVPGAE